MQNNVKTQYKHMYLLNIGSLCNVALTMAGLTGIMTIQSGIREKALRSAFIGAEKTFSNSLQL